MAMIIIGVVLMLAAIAGFFYMQHTKKELFAMIGTQTFPIPELERLKGVSDELGAGGGFRKAAEVVGAAHPRPEGLLTAEISKTECVWYRYRVDRQYEHVENRNGRRHYSKRTEKVADHASSAGFAVVDEDGRTIGVDPGGTRLDSAEQSVSRFEPHHGGNGGGELFGIKLPNFLGRGDGTIGFDYKEWIIRPGRRLYILGEVHDKIGPLVIGKPEQDGHFIISTRSEAELRGSRRKRHKLIAISVIAVAVIGVALLAAGIIF